MSTTALDVARDVMYRFKEYDYSALSDNVTGEVLGLGLTAVGIAQVQEAVRQLYEEMFEAEVVYKNVFVDEHAGIMEYDIVGTHTGEVLGIPATGRKVNVPCIAVYDIKDGKITGIRMYFPSDIFLDQVRD